MLPKKVNFFFFFHFMNGFSVHDRCCAREASDPIVRPSRRLGQPVPHSMGTLLLYCPCPQSTSHALSLNSHLTSLV